MSRAGIRFLLNGNKSSRTHGGNSAEIKDRFAEAVRGFDKQSRGYFTLVGRFPGMKVGDIITIEQIQYSRKNRLRTIRSSYERVVTQEIWDLLEGGRFQIPEKKEEKPKQYFIGVVGGRPSGMRERILEIVRESFK